MASQRRLHRSTAHLDISIGSQEFHSASVSRLNAIVENGANAFALEVLKKFASHFRVKSIGIQMPIVGEMRQSQVIFMCIALRIPMAVAVLESQRLSPRLSIPARLFA